MPRNSAGMRFTSCPGKQAGKSPQHSGVPCQKNATAEKKKARTSVFKNHLGRVSFTACQAGQYSLKEAKKQAVFFKGDITL